MPAPDLVPTRRELHRIAAHVLGRRRYEVAGRFGLRASPGGFATPAFGDGPEVLRLSGAKLIRERPAGAALMSIRGATLRRLARFAGADLDAEFSVGENMPAVGDPDAAIHVDPTAVDALAEWLDLGWRVIDAVLADLGPGSDPAVLQLWPEHFDAGTNVEVGPDRRANLGFSLGDDLSSDPYMYVGPWGPERPGDPDYWNVPFGALLRSGELGPDRERDARRFLGRGLEYLRGSTAPGQES